MKHAGFAVLLGVLVLTLAAVCLPSVAQAQWKVIIPQTLFADKLRAAAFLNEDFGLTGGPETSARRTIPWMAVQPGPQRIPAEADYTPLTSWMSIRSGCVG